MEKPILQCSLSRRERHLDSITIAHNPTVSFIYFFFILFIYLLFFRSSIASSVFTEAHRNRIFFSWLFFFASFFFCNRCYALFSDDIRTFPFQLPSVKPSFAVPVSIISDQSFFFSFFFLGDRSTILAHWGKRNISKKKKKSIAFRLSESKAKEPGIDNFSTKISIVFFFFFHGGRFNNHVFVEAARHNRGRATHHVRIP